MRQLLPTPSGELSDDDLLAAYAPPAGPGPHVRVNFVSSADGAAWLDGRSGGLSSPADKRVFGLLRDLADVMLVGGGHGPRRGLLRTRPSARSAAPAAGPSGWPSWPPSRWCPALWISTSARDCSSAPRSVPSC